MSRISKKQRVIRTLIEAAAACGRVEVKRRKRANVVRALQFLFFSCFFIGTARQLTALLSHIERGEKKKHGVVFAKILYVTKYDLMNGNFEIVLASRTP